ncbi:MAG: hypothetical protein M1829_001739 [Trizodia sp. TS-e1964]|nr:MAG: hypothetical protein M1829_001739 [Trizodia sp. TS-e1964]
MATFRSMTGQEIDRAALDALLRHRLFYTPAFGPYEAVGGLFDYGPDGTALQTNIINSWREHFVFEEDMLELDCPVLTPHDILQTSGHVEKFSDWMCKDPKTGEHLRADHLVEQVLEDRLNKNKLARGLKVEAKEEDAKSKKNKLKSKDAKPLKLDDVVVKEYEEVLARIDNYSGEELGILITKYNITNPNGNNIVEQPIAFNLMFKTSIGPSSNSPAYLRPETAQGQFLNFQKLYEFNNRAMPFASASVGKSFRNEISPRSGLLRVREFTMAEIEHYVDPEGGKKHARFEEVRDVELVLLNRHVQLEGKIDVEKISIGRAVASGLVDNETLGYFMARIHLFLKKIGIDQNKIRFRQHMANEMAHYAADCWDAELHTSYGWIECVGCADRSAYDLTVHSERMKVPLVVRERLDEPLRIEQWQVELNKKKAGPKFKTDSKAIEATLEALTQEQRETLAGDMETNGRILLEVPSIHAGSVELDKDILTIAKRTEIKQTREYVPNVIEPSFGIGRILYSLIEHVYWTREQDEARGVLSFPPSIAPSKVLIVPLSGKEAFKSNVSSIRKKLNMLKIRNRTDDFGATIGKRYSRNDELGTPFGITVDFQSIKDQTVTLRWRDTTEQVRASEDEIVAAIKSVIEERETWEDIKARLPKFTGQEID